MAKIRISSLEATVNIVTLLTDPRDAKVLLIDEDLLFVVQVRALHVYFSLALYL